MQTFNSYEELNNFLTEHKLDLNNYSVRIEISPIEKIVESVEPVIEKKVEQTIMEGHLINLSDSPSVPVELSDKNRIYVERCENISDACSTAKITIMGREILTNVCDMNGIKIVNLDVAISEKHLYAVPFEIVEGKEHCTLTINEDTYNDSSKS